MKSKLVFTLLITSFLFSGCYSVLLVGDATENGYVEPAPAPQPTDEYIQVYYPTSVPEHMPGQPQYLPPATYVSDRSSSPPPSSNDHRPIQTGRGSVNPNPPPVKNDNNNNGTRDSGVQRGKR